MTLFTMILVLISVFSVSVAQALVKHGLNRVGGVTFTGDQFLASMHRATTDIFIVAGFLLTLMAIPVWLTVLSRLQLSVAYPLASFGYVIAFVIGAVFFKETITPLRMFGMLLIIFGGVAIAKSQ